MENKSRKQRFLTELVWVLCCGVGKMPYWFQYYLLQEIIYFVLRYVMHYRRKLIMRQLRESFPERDGREVTRICNAYYNTLAEMIVNTITLAGMSDEERTRRVTFHGTDEVRDDIRGKNCIALTSHYGFWEYYPFASLWLHEHQLVVAYHKLKDPVMDEIMLRLRRTDRVTPVNSAQFLRYYIQNQEGIDGRNLALGMVSDQNSPPRGKEVHWFRFLNHDTIFFDGAESLAMKFHLPVYYMELSRIKRGYYNCRFVRIHDGVEPVEQYEITERFVRLLENAIVAKPELWMWSHNRWKYRPDKCYANGRPMWQGNYD